MQNREMPSIIPTSGMGAVCRFRKAVMSLLPLALGILQGSLYPRRTTECKWRQWSRQIPDQHHHMNRAEYFKNTLVSRGC